MAIRRQNRPSSLERRLRAEIDKIAIVDTHEHLFQPHVLADRESIDVGCLFTHYAGPDLVSAGGYLSRTSISGLCSKGVSE